MRLQLTQTSHPFRFYLPCHPICLKTFLIVNRYFNTPNNHNQNIGRVTHIPAAPLLKKVLTPHCQGPTPQFPITVGKDNIAFLQLFMLSSASYIHPKLLYSIAIFLAIFTIHSFIHTLCNLVSWRNQ
jgi:hypothetical protein